MLSILFDFSIIFSIAIIAGAIFYYIFFMMVSQKPTNEKVFFDMPPSVYEAHYVHIMTSIGMVCNNFDFKNVTNQILFFQKKYLNDPTQSKFVVESDITRLLNMLEEREESLSVESKMQISL